MVDGLPIRKRQGVEVLYLRALRVANDRSVLIAKRDAMDSLQLPRSDACKLRQQLRDRQLALADHHDVGPAFEILGYIVRALGAAQDHRPLMLLGRADDFQYRAASHEIGVDANGAPGLAGEALSQSIALLERAVEHVDRISACLEERRQIEQAEGWYGFMICRSFSSSARK